MAVKTTLGDLRNGIEVIYRDIMREAYNGEAPNAVVLERVRRDFGDEIRKLSSQLENIALVKLLNEVSNRRAEATRVSLCPTCSATIVVSPNTSRSPGALRRTRLS